MSDQASRVLETSWLVPVGIRAVRLDSFIRRCLPQLSRRVIEYAIHDKRFWVNGKVGKKGDKLSAGDRLSFRGPDHWLVAQPIPDPNLRVPIVYEDAFLLVVDKPAGMATHGFSGKDLGTLANFLAASHPDLGQVGKGRWEPGLVHRLDRETSGLILVAKSQAAFEQLRRQFRLRQVKKKYWALVWGKTAREGVISYPLAHDASDQRRMRALIEPSTRSKSRKIWSAVTRFRTLDHGQGLSLLEIQMETGVTHQIRVHLAAMGYPLVGDLRYGTEHRGALGLSRHFLHAAALEFCHPHDGATLKVEAPLPAELQAVLNRCKLKL